MKRSVKLAKQRAEKKAAAVPGQLEENALAELEKEVGHKHPFDGCAKTCQGHLSLGEVALCRAYQTRHLSDDEKAKEWERWPKAFKNGLKRVAPELYTYRVVLSRMARMAEVEE